MKHFKYSVSLMMVLALALVFIGCAKPPEAEQKAAKAAMDAAVSAGADKYAAADLDAAKKVWDAAEAQVKDKKYKEAKQGYVDAKAAFEKAAGAVAAGKKAVTDEATAAVAAVEEGLEGRRGRRQEGREEDEGQEGRLGRGCQGLRGQSEGRQRDDRRRSDRRQGKSGRAEGRHRQMGSRIQGDACRP